MKRLPSTRHERSGLGSPRRHHATGQTEGGLAGVLFLFLSVLVALPAYGLVSSVPCPPSSTDYDFSLARYVACPPSRWPARRIFRGSLAISPPPYALDGGPRAGPVPSRTGSDGPSERVGRRAELRRAHAADPAPPARPVRAPTSPGPARGSEQGLPGPSVRALRRARPLTLPCLKPGDSTIHRPEPTISNASGLPQVSRCFFLPHKARRIGCVPPYRK
jgi:hypothetical protein